MRAQYRVEVTLRIDLNEITTSEIRVVSTQQEVPVRILVSHYKILLLRNHLGVNKQSESRLHRVEAGFNLLRQLIHEVL